MLLMIKGLRLQSHKERKMMYGANLSLEQSFE